VEIILINLSLVKQKWDMRKRIKPKSKEQQNDMTDEIKIEAIQKVMLEQKRQR
jgi:hypothetical protein